MWEYHLTVAECTQKCVEEQLAIKLPAPMAFVVHEVTVLTHTMCMVSV